MFLVSVANNLTNVRTFCIGITCIDENGLKNILKNIIITK